MDVKQKAILLHEKWRGKLETRVKSPLNTREDLALAYTPGVAEPCKLINSNPELSYNYTARGNLVAVISDGSAVLGLGNIGGLAGMPVMEGKCALFKHFAGVDAVPIVLDTQDTEEVIKTVKNIAPSFGGINLEDISAPRCFEIESRLKQELDIPVFHDDQHGTAVVLLAAAINSFKLAKKDLHKAKVCISGPGAAGKAIALLLIDYGVDDVIMCDSRGILHSGRENLDWSKQELVKITNKHSISGTLKDAIVGADMFVGVSAAGIVSADMVKSMAKDAIVFAMANPDPEIYPPDAIKAGALVAGSGRSDFCNQVNNVLAFPGIFKGAFKVRASKISEGMKKSAAEALANLVEPDKLCPSYVLPDALDSRVANAVADAVAKQAVLEGLARI